jgi:hypothetical protein
VKKATLEKGIELCEAIYLELGNLGYFPALTGGSLYKEGKRKDIDIVIYRHRQKVDKFEMRDIKLNLENIGLTEFQFYSFVTKAKWQGFCVDLLNPETKVYSEEEYTSLLLETNTIKNKQQQLNLK